MTERSAGTEVFKTYTIDQLQGALAGEVWQGMEPNLPTPADLDPRTLQAGQVDGIVDALLEHRAITGPMDGVQQHPGRWAHAPEAVALPAGARLDKVGFGESRVCYKYTAPDGKVMAVLFGAYTGELGVQVPPDPRLTQSNQNLNRRLWTYSDLRTYLCLPTGRYTGVTFQEFGGSERPAPCNKRSERHRQHPRRPNPHGVIQTPPLPLQARQRTAGSHRYSS
jgi:hypothetical protein